MVTARWQTRHRVELPADQWSPLAGWYPTRPRSANTPVGRAQQAVTVPLVANGLAGARSTLAWAILARKPLYAVDPAVATWLAHRPVGRRGQQLSQGRGRAVRVWLEGAADHQPGTGAGTSCFHRVPHCMESPRFRPSHLCERGRCPSVRRIDVLALDGLAPTPSLRPGASTAARCSPAPARSGRVARAGCCGARCAS